MPYVLLHSTRKTVIPRTPTNTTSLLQGTTQPLNPPFPTAIPLWLALLLKRQRRANIQPPPWLNPESLHGLLEFETDDRTAEVFSPNPALPPPTTNTNSLDQDPTYLHPSNLEPSPPFLKDSSTSRAQPDALPYHWLELSHLLLSHAGDDFPNPEVVRKLLRDLQEVRMSKLRKGFKVLDAGAAVKMNGVGGMEVAEVRGFVGGVVDGLRKIGRSKEEARRERDEEEAEEGMGAGGRYESDEDEDDMQM